MSKVDYERTPDGFQRIMDANLKVEKALFIPVFTGAPTLNNNTDEAGAIAINSGGQLIFYHGGIWNICQTLQYFVGKYTSLAALQAAYPVGFDGAYAFIDVTAETAQQYIWDSVNTVWTASGGGGGTDEAASETVSGIVKLSTNALAVAATDDQTALTPLKGGALFNKLKKLRSFETNPFGVTEITKLMQYAGQINTAVFDTRCTAIKLKIGATGTYPSGAQTYPFAYSAGDLIYISIVYTDLNQASCNIILNCQDN